MKIAIMEKTNFSDEQVNKLKSLGDVDLYVDLSQEDANEIAPKYDVVIVNWLDPTPFLLKMRPGSMVALLSTGFGWITNLQEAQMKKISVSNIPQYSTEAVAEHLLGLLLGMSKDIFPALLKSRTTQQGFELKNKVVGIIGLGKIGSRFAEIMNFFDAKVITYNRNKKNSSLAQDVSLETLLAESDIICITCSSNESSKNMINVENCNRIKKGCVIIGSTWNIIDENVLLNLLKSNNISSASFDAAVEGAGCVSKELESVKDLFLTPHIAFNTKEAEKRQLEICISNIESFIRGSPKNIINI